MSSSKVKSILHTKVLLNNGVLVEMRIWKIPKDERYPDGYKYSLYASFGDTVIVGYDNHHPKGHHRHIDKEELRYNFKSLVNLKNDFIADLEVEMIKKGLK